MIKLYLEEDYKKAIGKDLLLLECKHCHKPFTRTKTKIKHYIKTGHRGDFCSKKCIADSKNSRQTIDCQQCKKPFVIKKYRASTAHFCSRSCQGKWIASSNGRTGFNFQRSKLEKWIENQLTKLYPNLKILYNDRSTINAELDIFIPSLNLAFELNGIFHYEPIYGKEQLKKVQSNDNRRFQACIEKGIELCLIDTSKHRYFKEATCLPYLKIITDLIEQKKQLNYLT